VSLCPISRLRFVFAVLVLVRVLGRVCVRVRVRVRVRVAGDDDFPVAAVHVLFCPWSPAVSGVRRATTGGTTTPGATGHGR
jgi:hypothetical protein